jgi:hypothetical protein
MVVGPNSSYYELVERASTVATCETPPGTGTGLSGTSLLLANLRIAVKHKMGA